MPSQQPSYQGMMGVQQPQNPGLINSQRAGMGGQMQSMMVQYQQMPSYQVSTHTNVSVGCTTQRIAALSACLDVLRIAQVRLLSPSEVVTVRTCF